MPTLVRIQEHPLPPALGDKQGGRWLEVPACWAGGVDRPPHTPYASQRCTNLGVTAAIALAVERTLGKGKGVGSNPTGGFGSCYADSIERRHG